MWYRCSNGAREHAASLYASDNPRTGLHQPVLASISPGSSSSSCSSSSRAQVVQPEGAQVVQPVPVSTPRQQAIQQLRQGPKAASIAATPQPGAVDASSVGDQALNLASNGLLKQYDLAPAGPELLPAPLPQSPAQAAACAAAAPDTRAVTGPKQQHQQQQQLQPRLVSTSLQGPAPANCGSAGSPPRASPPPAVEVELQRANSSCINSTVSGSSNTGRPASPCRDPLLHWSEIWSGPGIPGVRRRQNSNSSSSSRVCSRPAAAPAATAAATASGAGSPQCSSPPAASVRSLHVWWAGIEQSQPPHSPCAAAAAAAAGNGAASTASAASPSPAAPAGQAAAPKTGASKRKDTSKNRSCSSTMDMRSQQQMQIQQLPSSLREALQIQQQQQQVQLAQPLLSRSSSSSATPGTRTQQQQQQQGSSIKWWLFGGAALAVISGSAVVAAYVTISYMMKAAMVYSFAWKAATGVAAAEGLAIGGWGCSSVRKQKAAAAASAADLARLQSQAAKELAALRGLLQQREAEHGQELTSLSTLNERLNHLSQSLRTENSNLQGALERAAAERKSLEAAAALQAAHAQSGALVEVAAAHSERVVDEVAELVRGQQQLVSLVCELREDLLGLVTDKDVTDMLVTVAGSGVSVELADELAAGSSNASLEWLRGATEPAVEQAAAAAGATTSGHMHSCNAAAAEQAGQAGVGGKDGAELDMFAGNGSGSCNGVLCKPPGLRLKSVRGSVDAALAASIAETLQL